MLASAKRLLGSVWLYVGLQRAVGADRVRYRCLSEVDSGDTVLDVGCGPAYYVGRLPEGVRYVGFDTSPRYIDHARKRWGDRAEFRCEVFGEEHLAELPPVDKVLLLGLLHHLSDEDCRTLLDLAARALAPGGVAISADPTFEPGQGFVSRWMSANDRGGFVREPDGFTALATASFGDVDGEIVSGITRVPTSSWLMRMRGPLVAARPR